jgi:hypothetical protein
VQRMRSSDHLGPTGAMVEHALQLALEDIVS